MEQTIALYQSMVDNTVRKLGGYWRPLSGLARMMEELGELSEVLQYESLNSIELAEELADLFIITSSIANQYCSQLDKEIAQLGYSPKITNLYQSVQDLDNYYQALLQLNVKGGHIARILNHYEGDKKKKPTERKQRLAQEIAEFHLELVRLAKFYNIDLFSTIEAVLSRDLLRDKNRFEQTHDPTTEASLSKFKNVVEHTEFRGLSKLWGSYEWDSLKSLEQNLENSLPTLNRFIKCGEQEELEGFILEISDREYFNNENSRNDSLKRVLAYFYRNDPTKKDSDDYLNSLESYIFFTYRDVQFDWIPFIAEESLFIMFLPKY